MTAVHRPVLFIQLILLFLLTCQQAPFVVGRVLGDGVDARHSYSLTTFDPTGKLGQVVRACQAASLGTPIVAISVEAGIILAAPQVLPSPLMKDDGTARFARITEEILMGHSGLSADGRVLVAAAQKMAIEHEYTYDEPMPVQILLQEMSLLLQEYTMKPASRPFGVTLLVAAPSKTSSNHFFRIDPSGAVTTLGNYAIVGSLEQDQDLSSSLASSIGSATMEDHQSRVVSLLRQALNRLQSMEDDKKGNPITILTASIEESQGITMHRHE